MKYLITLFCLTGSISLYANTEKSSNTNNQFQVISSPLQLNGDIGNTVISQDKSSSVELANDVLRKNNINQTTKKPLMKNGVDEIPAKDGLDDIQKEAGDGQIRGKTCWPVINEDGTEECVTFKDLIK